MASGDKETFPVAGVIQSSSRIIISQQSPSPSPGASKPQSYKVFVLPPSQLNSLGLVAKNENGRVILTERAIESTVSHNAAPNSNAAMSLAFIKTPEGIQIQSGQSSSSVKTTPKRGYVASAEVVKGAARELQVHRPVTKISTPGTNALGASSSRPMFA
ncbi:hypothetical protein R5R35_005740 [Gryllus longicercus]|uniref:Uncharacterized protein n=1 Tax=Gryllus longicercus TaxID=2509291 RepID=A0AAN9WRV7_9ORTH